MWHNIDNITHHVVLNDRSVDTGDLAPGQRSAPLVARKAGTYLFVCNLPGHFKAGMFTVVTVK